MTPCEVCFGARSNSYGVFKIPVAGNIITFKLKYLHGHVSCYGADTRYLSRWGCIWPGLAPHEMGTYITDAQRNLLLPKSEYRKGGSYLCGRMYYNLPWATSESPELLFDNFSTPLQVSAGQEFQVWFVEDLILHECVDDDNGWEKTCAKVYGLYL